VCFFPGEVIVPLSGNALCSLGYERIVGRPTVVADNIRGGYPPHPTRVRERADFAGDTPPPENAVR